MRKLFNVVSTTCCCYYCWWFIMLASSLEDLLVFYVYMGSFLHQKRFWFTRRNGDDQFSLTGYKGGDYLALGGSQVDLIATQSKSSDQIITSPKGFHSLIVAYLAERHNVSERHKEFEQRITRVTLFYPLKKKPTRCLTFSHNKYAKPTIYKPATYKFISSSRCLRCLHKSLYHSILVVALRKTLENKQA